MGFGKYDLAFLTPGPPILDYGLNACLAIRYHSSTHTHMHTVHRRGGSARMSVHE